MKVYSTTEYDKFQFIDFNRDIKKFRKLTDSMCKYGFLECVPIIVTPTFEIIDGQHRFTIAKDLGLPVSYVIENKYDAKEIMVPINESKKNWALSDCNKFFIDSDNECYQVLDDLRQKHPSLPLGFLVRILGKQTSCRETTLTQIYRHGKIRFRFSNKDVYEYVSQLDICISQIKSLINAKKNLSYEFMSAIFRLISTEGFKLNIFQQKLETYVNDINVCNKLNNVNDITLRLLEIYNKRLNKSNQLILKW